MMALVGAALLGQQNYADAEPMLLNGYRGLKECKERFADAQREKRITDLIKVRMSDAIQQLVTLYQATDKPEEAAKWKAELEASKDSGNSEPETQQLVAPAGYCRQ